MASIPALCGRAHADFFFLFNGNEQRNQAIAQVDYEISPNDPLPPEYLDPLKSLWADAGVQKAILKGNEYALHDNLA